MKRTLVSALLLALMAFGACRTPDSTGTGTRGEPDPPFAPPVPEEAYVIDSEPGVYGGTMVMALPFNPKSFNPISGAEVSTAWVVSGPIYTALVTFNNARQEDEPSLARSWESSPDGLVWTFNLRKGVRWSDGEPFTADDVLFNFEVCFDPNTRSPIRDLFEQSDGSLPRVEKVDDHTVRFTLIEPLALFVSSIGATYLLPKHKWEPAYRGGTFNQSLLLDTKPEDIVGTGPFRIVSFATEERIVLERNPHYWKIDREGQRLPYIDRVVFMIVPDTNAVTLKFENGEVDMHFDVSPDSVERFRRNQERGNYTLHDLGPSFRTDYIVFNQDESKFRDKLKLKWFRNPVFRQAISYAINREGIVRTVFNGHGVPIYSFDSPANKVWYTDEIVKTPHDPEKAREMLREIGIFDRNGDGRVEDADGNPVRFTINVSPSRAYRVRMGELIRDDLAAIGIEATLRPIDFNQLIESLQSTRDFEAAILGWQSGVPPDPILAKVGLLPTAANYYAYPKQNPPSTEWERELDRLVRRNAMTLDLEERKKYHHEAMKIWSEYRPEIDLTAANHFVAGKNNLGNFKPSPLALFTYWNIEELYFKE